MDIPQNVIASIGGVSGLAAIIYAINSWMKRRASDKRINEETARKILLEDYFRMKEEARKGWLLKAWYQRQHSKVREALFFRCGEPDDSVRFPFSPPDALQTGGFAPDRSMNDNGDDGKSSLEANGD